QRLNWMALAYGQSPEIRRHIRETYPAWWMLLVVIALVGLGLYICFKRLLGRQANAPGTERPHWAAATQTVLLATLGVIACRGGLGREPLSRDEANYTRNNLVSQLTLNNFVTATDACKTVVGDFLNDYEEEIDKHDLPDLEVATAVASEMFYSPSDIPSGSGLNPMWRRTQTGRPRRQWNVVVILMEGLAGKPVGALGHSPSHTPNFDALSRQGLYFDRMYAVGARTSRGVSGTLCGYPDLGGPSILTRKRALGRFLTLPQVFRRRGYHTMFIYGGDADFDNMRAFLTSGSDRAVVAPGGVDEIIQQDQMGVKPDIWGVPDEYVFAKAHERFVAMGDRPFFSVILTVSNHEPHHVPAGRCALLPGRDEETAFLNAYRYADWALGDFLRKAEEAPYFENTLFVLVADHGRRMDQRLILDIPAYRVPCLFFGPVLEEPIQPRTVSTVCSQTDLPVTLLSMLGGTFEHCFLGRNVLEVPPGDGFALLHEGDHLGFVRGNRAVVSRPDGGPVFFETDGPVLKPLAGSIAAGADRLRLNREMLSLYRMALYLYSEQAFSRPPMPLATSMDGIQPGR
ncbi:MAG: LTA synthase family protein, partial [Phycisphaerae bacterium]